jgi:hypothetical protein
MEKLNEGVNEPPLVDLGGSYSYIFDYIRDYCKPYISVSY